MSSSEQFALARQGDTIFVSSLILEHPQERSVRVHPSWATPSTMQLMEHLGRLSRRAVMLPVVDDDAQAARAAKKKTRMWTRAFILGNAGRNYKYSLERDSLCNGTKRKKRKVFCSTKRRRRSGNLLRDHTVYITHRKPAGQRKKGPPQQDEITSLTFWLPPYLTRPGLPLTMRDVTPNANKGGRGAC